MALLGKDGRDSRRNLDKPWRQIPYDAPAMDKIKVGAARAFIVKQKGGGHKIKIEGDLQETYNMRFDGRLGTISSIKRGTPSMVIEVGTAHHKNPKPGKAHNIKRRRPGKPMPSDTRIEQTVCQRVYDVYKRLIHHQISGDTTVGSKTAEEARFVAGLQIRGGITAAIRDVRNWLVCVGKMEPAKLEAIEKHIKKCRKT